MRGSTSRVCLYLREIHVVFNQLIAPQPNASKSRGDGAVKFEQAKSSFWLYNIQDININESDFCDTFIR
ncbi:hypothetical protein SORBI_3009G214800 [Sorghum bicolor]|uniref:Uncharacterized protein n=1 Tax=Sorghum bicolor TaxID=4558 RepID=A0A1B6P9T7_SORBI|nr:hypothetical protein SORBI_3009G214800 [Sorghum bicolor]